MNADLELEPPKLSDFIPAAGAVVTLVCAAIASCMAIGGILVAMNADLDNPLVHFIYRVADGSSLGIFKRFDGLVEFSGGAAAVRDGLFNWGLGALVWMAIGYGAGWAIRTYGPRLVADLPHPPEV